MRQSDRAHEGKEGEPQESWHSLPDDDVLRLASLAHDGDVAAEYALYDLCGPLRNRIRARYQLHPTLAAEWPGALYVYFNRYIKEFDPKRSCFRAYLEVKLRKAMWTWVRAHQKTMHREAQLSAAATATLTDDCPAVEAEERLLAWAEQDYLGQAPGRTVEEVAVLRLWLREALNDLSSLRREVFVLWANGFTCEQIAEHLGITAKACYKHLERARGDLRRAWEKSLE
jgi:RNA polymerase sigma factor (sigma-70 family)